MSFTRILGLTAAVWLVQVVCIVAGGYATAMAGMPAWAKPWLVGMGPALVAIAAALALTRFTSTRNWLQSAGFLGLTGASLRYLGYACIAVAPIFVVAAMTTVETGSDTSPFGTTVRILEIVIVYGVAQEVLFRGFVFHHLRQSRGLVSAALLAAAVFALVHITDLIGFHDGAVVVTLTSYVGHALLGLIVAYPAALLFEKSGNSVWPGIVLQSAIHLPRVILPAEPGLGVVALRLGAVLVTLAAVVVLGRKGTGTRRNSG